MPRPRKDRSYRFTSTEAAIAAAVPKRAWQLLETQGLTPEPIERGAGKRGVHYLDTAGLAHAALIGAWHGAGLNVVLSARLAAAVVAEYGAGYVLSWSKLSSLERTAVTDPAFDAMLRTPSWEGLSTADTAWLLLEELRRHPQLYQPGRALKGDGHLELVDGRALYLRTPVRTVSPITRRSLEATPEAIVTSFERGAEARVESFLAGARPGWHDDPEEMARLAAREAEMLDWRANGVAAVVLNVSLAIRVALDRVYDYRRAPVDARGAA